MSTLNEIESANINSLTTSQVRELQSLLSIQGYDLIMDGIAGMKTKQALANFKDKNFLAYPDIVGKSTVEALRQVRKPTTDIRPVGEQLTEHFTLAELLISQTASRMRLDNTPSEDIKRNLKLTAQKILQPIRNHYQRPVVVSSGYRSLPVNRAVGGSSRSQHMTGQAVDFTVPGVDNYSVALWISQNLKYDQLILEFYTGGNSGWVHVGYSSAHKMQTLTINRFGTYQGLKKY
jgi:zinc D-Ala-D-Ala carboxypeptidase